jgi:hypothetical protein
VVTASLNSQTGTECGEINHTIVVDFDIFVQFIEENSIFVKMLNIV